VLQESLEVMERKATGEMAELQVSEALREYREQWGTKAPRDRLGWTVVMARMATLESRVCLESRAREVLQEGLVPLEFQEMQEKVA